MGGGGMVKLINILMTPTLLQLSSEGPNTLISMQMRAAPSEEGISSGGDSGKEARARKKKGGRGVGVAEEGRK